MVIDKKDLNFFKEYEIDSSSIIPILQHIQDKFGYLPREALIKCSKYLGVPLSRIYGVATFYSQFNFTPLGKYVVKICHGTACHVNGAVNIAQELMSELGIEEGETTADGLITLQPVACLGCCSLAPVLSVNDKIYGNLSIADVRRIVKKIKKDESI
ncbi:MAG: NADH-quinone oxidoreductase subunit NuoE [Candidatus Heimdallarchaeota archaeon]